MPKHKLGESLLAAINAHITNPSKATTKQLRLTAREICRLLDGISARAQAAGQAGKGKSGRKSVAFNLDKAKKLREAGESIESIAKTLGVSPMTASRRLQK